jgi:hypothetical protein
MKKIYSILITIILFTMVVPISAFAAENSTEGGYPASFGGGRLNFGKISEIGLKGFTITTRGGGSFTYLVDENTKYRMKESVDPGYNSLEIGQFTLVLARRLESDLYARVVVTTPEGFNPARWFGIRARGEILRVDLEEGAFTVLKPSGEEIEYKILKRTRFIGQASDLVEMDTGWVIGVLGGEAKDGTYFATVIAAAENPRRVRKAGLVTSLDDESSSLSILTRDGEDMTFSVDEETRFHSRGGEIGGLDDLQLDMVVVLQAILQENGSYLVKHIAAAEKEDLPNFEVKKAGQITIVEADSFTLETRDGTEITIEVDNETKFRSRGLDVESLDDVQVGMIVLIGGDQGEGGAILARLVLVIQNPGD